MDISKEFANIRKQAGLTQKELSSRTGVGLRFIRNLEQGGKNFRYDKLELLLDFLGAHLEIQKNKII
ncbi:MAG: helix-turn-helix domain-containing protein [Elusimicrobiota bacterium]|jgi:transcriptional regulator with XRE-family HTH domain|nr:helix-turn-helix domain-containing protein [Elusimicrobiota bacterium]